MASFSATRTYIQTTESTKIDQPKEQETKKQAGNDYFLFFPVETKKSYERVLKMEVQGNCNT